MKDNVLHTAVDWESLLSLLAALTHLTVLVHVQKPGSARTHHRHVTAVLPVLFIQYLYMEYIFFLHWHQQEIKYWTSAETSYKYYVFHSVETCGRIVKMNQPPWVRLGVDASPGTTNMDFSSRAIISWCTIENSYFYEIYGILPVITKLLCVIIC